MATTTSSRFLAIGSGEPNINTGWTFHVLDYKDMKTLVAVISECTEFSFTQELSKTGQGSITLDEDSPFWTAILNDGNSNRALMNHEYVIEAWDNNTPRFSWLAQTVTNTIVGSDETKAVVLSGPGIAQCLSWAVIARPGWPTKVPIIKYQPSQADPKAKTAIYRATSPTDKLPAFQWQFPITYPSMRMWYTVFKAAQRRGLLAQVTPMFTALKDSEKKPWVWIKVIGELVSKQGYQPSESNQTLLEFLDDCTGQDYSKWFGQRLEWMMYPGFKLDVRTRIGADKSKTVRFFQGNIISDERTRDREMIYNRVIAQDDIGNESIRTDTASVAKWNLREQWNTTNKQVELDAMREQLAGRYIQQSKDEKDQWSIQIPYDDPGRVPYRNFAVGDHIGVNVDFLGSTPTAVSAPTKYRVMAITVSMTADQTVPDCELTLQSLIDSKQDELQKQITQLLNNPKNVDINNIKQISIPQAPTTASTLTYNPDTKKWEATPITAGGGTGGGGSNNVFVQKVDPASQAGVTVNPGDFWLETYD